MEPLQELTNKQMDRTALRCLTATGTETAPGFCLRWVRQVAALALGPKGWPLPTGLDAKQAAVQFRVRGLTLADPEATVPGDLLFFTGPGHGKHGHVGIRITGNRMAENSSVHVGGRDTDARGVRSLEALGRPSYAVRLRPAAK